jgi:hypothetical protein
MKPSKQSLTLALVTVVALSPLAGCGKKDVAGNGHITLQTHALAGPSAAALRGAGRYAAVAGDLAGRLLGIGKAWAAVSSFATFKACNDTMIFLDQDGRQLSVNGLENPSIGQGLLTFDPSSGAPMALGTLDLPAGTVLSEIRVTFAVVPSVCSGANYAVQFDNGAGGGVRDITQNTAFRFRFASPGRTISGADETIDLKLGDIVNAMVSLGSSLDNSTVQTINVGQAE